MDYPVGGDEGAVGVGGFREVTGEVEVVFGAADFVGEIVEPRTLDRPRGDGAWVIAVKFHGLDFVFDAGPKLVESVCDLFTDAVQGDHVERFGGIAVDEQGKDLGRFVLLRVAVVNDAEIGIGEDGKNRGLIFGPKARCFCRQKDVGFEIGTPGHAIDGLTLFGRERRDELNFKEPEEGNSADYIMRVDQAVFIGLGLKKMNIHGIRGGGEDSSDAMIEGDVAATDGPGQSIRKVIVSTFDTVAIFAIAQKDVVFGNAVEGRDFVPAGGNFAFERNTDPIGNFGRDVLAFNELGEGDILEAHQVWFDWSTGRKLVNPGS